jgi:acetyl esterase/lipase
MTTTPVLPGRLGTPGLDIRDDPRADPRMIAAMEAVGMDVAPPPSPVTAATPIDELREYTMVAEAGFEMLGGLMLANTPPPTGITSHVETISGVDGNEITLFIHRPDDRHGPVPCVVHLHGGGMTLLSATGENYVRWRDGLAATGMVVVGVEFRNAGGKLGHHPFPAGLNDCISATRWVLDRRDDLGVSTVIVSGESGGGNLTLATALAAKQQGWVDELSGIYAQCPYIFGGYADPSPELVSLVENDDYFLNVENMGALAKVYDPDGENATNPLAWPMHATTDDVAGLPPHVISVNQLDPLRDEGLVYFRTLLAGGVSAVSRTVNGTCHAGDCLFLDAMPDVWTATIRDIKGFADSLRPS